jgi:hypothetical protein
VNVLPNVATDSDHAPDGVTAVRVPVKAAVPKNLKSVRTKCALTSWRSQIGLLGSNLISQRLVGHGMRSDSDSPTNPLCPSVRLAKCTVRKGSAVASTAA